jgi:hypothetical protein
MKQPPDDNRFLLICAVLNSLIMAWVCLWLLMSLG